MGGSASSNMDRKVIKALEQRARQILKARPAYQEMVDFYLTVFRRQIEWRDRLAVHPQAVDDEQRRACLAEGEPLVDRFDSGIESESLVDLWTEMKTVFREGNDALREAVEKVDAAEGAGDFMPAIWLLEYRPDSHEPTAEAADRIGVDSMLLETLTRAVTFPHWEKVAQAWLRGENLDEWRRFLCPTCGSPPGLAEDRMDGPAADGVTASPRRFMHCSFCGSRWVVPGLVCPTCDSTTSGDAKYYFTEDEPELRIDFCKSCDHYVKVVNADKIGGRVHVGLELLTTVHLDAIAHDKNLRPIAAGS